MKASANNKVHVKELWTVLIDGLQEIWPDSRAKLGGVSLGDVWECSVLPGGNNLVPFHKLSQWLSYSLLEPLQKLLHIQFEGLDDFTGLPEYRNGQ
jgi:hypothetical protein